MINSISNAAVASAAARPDSCKICPNEYANAAASAAASMGHSLTAAWPSARGVIVIFSVIFLTAQPLAVSISMLLQQFSYRNGDYRRPSVRTRQEKRLQKAYPSTGHNCPQPDQN